MAEVNWSVALATRKTSSNPGRVNHTIVTRERTV
jgi:hypothetical protein